MSKGKRVGRPRILDDPKIMSASVPGRLLDQARAAAKRQGTSLSALMRRALRNVVVEDLEPDEKLAAGRMDIETKGAK